MLEIPQYIVDAFADRPFSGNPAAVCRLESWLPDEMLQSIALENNLSETAFYVGTGERFSLRWFTPTVEVELCGHATLAAASVVFSEDGSRNRVTFESQGGDLHVSREGDFLWMDFPLLEAEKSRTPPLLRRHLGDLLKESRINIDLLGVLTSESAVRDLAPDLDVLMTIEGRGAIFSARADDPDYDFVSRYFAPKIGVFEDPVCGSAHSMLTHYWAGVLGKEHMLGRQISTRGGVVRCTLAGDRVRLGGRTRLFSKGTIYIE